MKIYSGYPGGITKITNGKDFYQTEDLSNVITVYVDKTNLTGITYSLTLEFLRADNRKTTLIPQAFEVGDDTTLTEDGVTYDIHNFVLTDSQLAVAGTLAFTCYINILNSGVVEKRGVLFNAVSNVRKTVTYSANTIFVVSEDEDDVPIIVADMKTAIETLAGQLASKVNKADVADNLTTNDSDKVLSAKQGYILNAMLDALEAATYTKTEVDSALALKADKSDTYTKTESDNAFAPKKITSSNIDSKLKSTLLELQDYANSSKLDGYYNLTTFNSSTTRYTLVYDVTDIEKIIVKGNFYQYSNSYTLLANNVITHYNTEYGNNKEFVLDVSDSDTLCVTAHADTIASIEVKALLIKNYTQVNANTNNIDYLTTISKGLERMYPSGYIKNKYYSNATLQNTTSRDLCVYDLTNVDKVIIKGTSIQYVNDYTFLDSNGTPVKYYQATASGTEFEYIIDCTNYAKLAVSVNYTINSPSQSTFYTYVYKYTNLALCNPRDDSHLKNRNIIWLGTSIPAGGTLGLNQPYSYPNILGKLLGCNMYNESVGSSCLHCRDLSLVDNDKNPYGFRSSFQMASRCLTNTLEMMEWIINWIDYRINGGTYQNEGTYDASVFTSSLPNSFTSDDADFIRSCSYENKLDKYLDSTTMKPDLIVIDHAHNDAPYNDTVWDENNPYSTFSYKGAVLFVLNHIYSKYPRVKILFMGHYENSYKSYIAEEQTVISTYTNIELFKLWEKLPFSYNVKCETDGYWYDSYGLWVDSGGTEQTIRMYDLWLRDGMHPHSDWTHRTERYIAEVIYPYINNVIIYNPIRNVNTTEGE